MIRHVGNLGSMLGRSAVVVGPMVGLFVWGGAYLGECLLYLEAPEAPLEVSVQSPGGPVAARAERYVIDVALGFIQLSGVTIHDPKGHLLASGRQLQITNLVPRFGSHQVIRVRGDGVFAVVERLPGGRLAVQDLLPPSTKEPSTTPFEVQLTDLKAKFVDRLGGGIWRRWVTSPALTIAGLGDDWTLSSSVKVQSSGVVSITAQRVAQQGVQIVGQTSGLEIAELLRHFAAVTPDMPAELQAARYQSIVVRGPIRVSLPEKRQSQIEAKVDVSAMKVAYNGYFADQVRYTGLATRNGLRGRLLASVGRSSLDFEGAAQFRPVQVAGQLIADVPNFRELPTVVSSRLPHDIQASGLHYRGWIATGSQQATAASGWLRADRLSYQKYTLSQVVGHVRTDGRQVSLSVPSAMYQGNAIGGIAYLNLPTKQVVAAIQGHSLDLGRILSDQTGYRGLTANVPMTATVEGSWANPVISVSTSGKARVAFAGGKSVAFDRVELAANYEKGALHLNRALTTGPQGLVRATGDLTRDGKAKIQVAARGIPLSEFSASVDGTANLRATISGSVTEPRVLGTMEAYETIFQNHTLPALQASFSLDRRKITFPDIRAFRGAATLRGHGAFSFANQRIAGIFQASDIEVADFAPEKAAAAGSVSVSDLRVQGTASKPLISATLTGPRLIVGGVKLIDVTAKIHQSGSRIRVSDIGAEVAHGKASGAVSYDLAKKGGEFRGQITNVDLGVVAPEIGDAATLDGKASFAVSGLMVNNTVRSASAKASLRDIALNNTTVGSGKLDAQLVDGHVKANLGIGQLDGFIELTNLDYGIDAKTLAGEVSALRIPVADIIQLGSRYLPETASEARTSLASLRGYVNLGGKVSGPLQDPDLKVDSLNLSELVYRDRLFGELTSAFRRDQGKWKIDAAKFSGKVGTLSVSGAYAEHGDLDLSGELSGLDLTELSQIDPRIPATNGKIDVSFLAQGPATGPDIQATLNGNSLFKIPGDNVDRGLRLALDTIHIAPGTLEASGNYFYRGFQGIVDAKAPFKYPLTIPPDEPISANMTVAERSLKEIAQLVDGLDGSRTDGSIKGNLGLAGSLNQPKLSGQILLDAPSIATPGVSDTVKGLKGLAKLESNKLTVTADGNGSRGGSFRASASTLLTSAMDANLKSILENPVSGTLTLEGFKFRQDFKNRAYIDGKLNADISVGGTLGAPRVSGSTRLAYLDSVLPPLESKAGATADPIINPSFDLRLLLDTPAHVRSSTADFLLEGSGSLKGSLKQPSLSAGLSVESGSIRLPGSLVRMDQGGSLTLSYVTDARSTQASFDVDLLGRTRIVTATGGSTIQRYDIELAVQGDLLKESGLTFAASSDPPGLSQDQILGLLGRTDLIASVASSGGQKTQNQIRDALAGYALPVVFDPITQGIARSLGLDYLSLEYNTFDQASVAFARTLNREFAIQGSRQLSEPAPGFPSRFDLRLAYKPRRFKGILSKFSFSVGADQDTPWKLSIDYGLRF